MGFKLRAPAPSAKRVVDEVRCPPGHDTTASFRTRAPASFKRLLGSRRFGTGATFAVLHIGERSRTLSEPELHVERRRIACQQTDSSKPLKLGVGQHRLR